MRPPNPLPARALVPALHSGDRNRTDSEEEDAGRQQSELHDPVGSQRCGQKDAIDVKGVESSKRQGDVRKARSNLGDLQRIEKG